MTPEQLLRVAEEFCAVHRVRVRSFGALVGAAAVATARSEGIPVHADEAAAGRALAESVVRLAPLTARNEEFAEVAREVFRRLHT